MFKHPRPILIVDDDVELVTLLVDYLQLEGFAPVAAHNGTEALELLSRQEFEIVVLDVMMPGMDGYQVARQVRAKRCGTPILMLTAKSSLEDRIEGLNAGADYYLTKPFEPEELLACVRSLLRRGGGDARTDDAITFGDLRLEPGTFQLSCGERSLRLSRREYDMLELLLRSQGRVVPKEQLLLKVWGYDSDAEDNNVEVYISFLRRKLTHLQSTVKIKTLRMVGYCLEVEA